MISQTELLLEMNRIGYPVAAQRLTIWRRKGLLPRLKSRGRGPKGGKDYFWKEDDVLERALLVYDALEHHVSAEDALLLLAHAGFDVDTKIARRTWIKRLTNLEKRHMRPLEINEQLDDQYWDRAVTLTAKSSIPDNIPQSNYQLLTANVLRTIYAIKDFRPSDDELQEIAKTVNQWISLWMKSPKLENADPIEISAATIKHLLELLRRGLSVTATKELIKGTTIDQFTDAMRYFKIFVCGVEALARMSVSNCQTGGVNRPIREIRGIFRAIIGPPLIAFILQLIGEGYERKLQKSLKLVEAYIRVADLNNSLKASPTNLEISVQLQHVTGQLFDQLCEIWRDFSLFRLYHIA